MIKIRQNVYTFLMGRLAAQEQSSFCALFVRCSRKPDTISLDYFSYSTAIDSMVKSTFESRIWPSNFMGLYTSVRKFPERVVYGKIACAVYSSSKVFPHIWGNV